MRAERHAAVFFLAVLCGTAAWATNPGFLPGDCCFLTSLTQEGVKEIQKTDSPFFGYHVPDPLLMKLCGYSGYWKLQVEGMPQQQRNALKSAYEKIREHQPRELIEHKNSETDKSELVETNPVRVLVVNRDFDFARYGVLGKYNESWPKESLATTFSGGRAPDGSYAPIVQDADVIIKEWFHGAEVAPLAVDLPAPLESTVGDQSPKAVKAKKPLRFILLPNRFEDYVQPEDGASLFVIDDGLMEYRYGPGDGWLKADVWEKRQDELEDEVNLPVDERGSKTSGREW